MAYYRNRRYPKKNTFDAIPNAATANQRSLGYGASQNMRPFYWPQRKPVTQYTQATYPASYRPMTRYPGRRVVSQAGSPAITVVHQFPAQNSRSSTKPQNGSMSVNGQVIPPVNGKTLGENITADEELMRQKIIRATYKQCLENAAQSGKSLTSAQRRSLRTAISTEAELQPPHGRPASPDQTGSVPYLSRTMIMDELASQLRSKLSTSVSASPPGTQLPAMRT